MLNINKYKLPSNGLLGYQDEVSIRSMTGRELSTAYSSLSDASIEEIIKGVIEPKIDLRIMADEDKLFILHTTRVLTFGKELRQVLRCPICGEIHDYEVNYDDFKIDYLDIKEESSILKLKDTDIEVKRKIPVAEDYLEAKYFQEKYSIPERDSFLILQALKVEYIKDDKKHYRTMREKVDYLGDLQGSLFMDIVEFVNVRFGLNTNFNVECKSCSNVIQGGVGISADFFRNANKSV